VTTQQAFSDELEAWLRSDGRKTLGSLEEVFAEKSFAVAIMLLMFPSALPVPTGGITHVFEVVTILVALQMVAGRRSIWLPKRWRDRELGGAFTGKAIPFVIRRVRWFERFSRRRLGWFFDQRWFHRVLGLLIIGLTAGAIVAPPFSGLDTLPSLGVVVICLAIIIEDALLLAIGLLIGTGGIVLIITIGSAIARLFRRVF
jgi:hypothetical protein